MRRESHVRFYEGLGVQLPRATRLVVVCNTKGKCEEAERRVRIILERLGLQLTRTRRGEWTSRGDMRDSIFSAVTCASGSVGSSGRGKANGCIFSSATHHSAA